MANPLPLARALPVLTAVLSAVALVSGCAASKSAGASSDVPDRVTGKVYYLAKIATPKDAPLTVRVVDVTDTAKPKVIGEQSLKISSVPADFSVKIDPRLVQPRHIYQVQADLTMGPGKVWSQRTAYPVLTTGAPAYAEVVVGPQR